jgi:uncharacterized protein YbjQ (UPF0145 family)
MRHLFTALILGVFVVGVPTLAGARDTFHDYDIQQAISSELGKEKLLDVPIYFAGQAHGAVASDLGIFTSNRRTNAFGKADEQACRIAFLSAVIALQTRAQKEGGNAVVDIKSITKHKELESSIQFRCVAGNVVANVVLSGRVVRIGK